MSDIIEYLKLGKLSLHKNLDNDGKEYDEINPMDISDDKNSDERYQISKNEKLKVSDVIEHLKL